MLRIGTSGWVYTHWRGLFYPPPLKQPEWFRFFAQHFDTVEINNSFYRLPSEAAFDTWREQAPPGFLYAVKASRFLTHFKKLKEPEPPLQLFFERAGRLGPTLGPVLYQLPPRWKLNLPRFVAFMDALPRGAHVVEFRDQSWVTDEVFAAMEQRGVSHCIHDMRGLEIPPRVTSSPVYVRFHGASEHGGDYSRQSLEAWGRRINDWRSQGLDVFVYFNNDWEGFALRNAETLRETCGVAAYAGTA
jgi:uncharacterized protein YecE (DUF72 family)